MERAESAVVGVESSSTPGIASCGVEQGVAGIEARDY